MKEILAAFLICVAPAWAQESVLLAAGHHAAGGGSVTIQNNKTDGTCTNGSATCTITGTVIGSTGDMGAVTALFCGNSGCTVSCTVTASDGTNTWTNTGLSGATITPATGTVGLYPLIAKNATAGTRTITATIAGAGCTFYYTTLYFADFAGANTTSPIDTSTPNKASGSGGTETVTTGGNITNANEVAYSVVALSSGTFTVGGSFSVLDNVATTQKSLDLVHPSSGATVTANGTSTANNWVMNVLAITP